MPKMMYRKDITFQLKRAEKELEEHNKSKNLEPQTASAVDPYVKLAREYYLKGRIEALKDVLG